VPFAHTSRPTSEDFQGLVRREIYGFHEPDTARGHLGTCGRSRRRARVADRGRPFRSPQVGACPPPRDPDAHVREDLPKLAHELTFEVDDLLPLVDAARLLGTGRRSRMPTSRSPTGRTFVEARHLDSKEIFGRKRASGRARAGICRSLESTKTGRWGGASSRLAPTRLQRGRGAPATRHSYRLGRYGRALRLRAPRRGSCASTGGRRDQEELTG